MNERRSICLVVDGLRASALGAYGNTTVATPNCDSLASKSQVVEWLWADSPDLGCFYRSAWQGQHALRAEKPVGFTGALDALKQGGVECSLLTDAMAVKQMAEAIALDDTLCLSSPPARTTEHLEETALAGFFAESIEYLTQWYDAGDASQLLWLHTQGMFGPWDAPLTLRQELLDEEDPDPLEICQPPERLSDVDDPDVLLGYRVAYAAQVKVFDACLGALLQALAELPSATETLLMVFGSRGFALGEHGAIGSDCDALWSERLHVPWLVHTLGSAHPIPRLGGLAQAADVGATLVDWFTASSDAAIGDGISALSNLGGKTDPLRQLAVATNDLGAAALRTPQWLLRTTSDACELYSKPDDRWENNDVASRCPEVVESLGGELERFQAACREGVRLPTEAAG